LAFDSGAIWLDRFMEAGRKTDFLRLGVFIGFF